MESQIKSEAALHERDAFVEALLSSSHPNVNRLGKVLDLGCKQADKMKSLEDDFSVADLTEFIDSLSLAEIGELANLTTYVYKANLLLSQALTVTVIDMVFNPKQG